MERWRALRAAGEMQFTPAPPWERPPPPSWLEALFRWLGDVFKPLARIFGTSWPFVEKALIVLAVLGVLWLGWVILAPLWRRRGAQAPLPDAAPDWAPAGEEALALLQEADLLASRGDYAGATHLLLRRSVMQLSRARPGLVHPASTAREIARMAVLPAVARAAFATIAGRVEASRYALRVLAQADWLAAREAYAAFARVADQAGVDQPGQERA
jgi:hypothetical protein